MFSNKTTMLSISRDMSLNVDTIDYAGGGGDATEWVGLVIGDADTTKIGRDTDEEEPADDLVEESEEDNNDVIDETEAPIEAKGRE